MTEDQVTLAINDQSVTVRKGTTILEAARSIGLAIPTLCWAENLTPVNVCRLCVVEAEGARTLVPACSRQCEDGAEIRTDTKRVIQSRRMVLELLASANDLTQSPDLQSLI
ncbi:MAG: 2Fe-2S iron-sulfur cluster-binding protein, partial [Acidimicrobiales bacterium]|nr:2Fe-2S iron-sulfur cluster-binding protein [Acidimicrobiales bacterium]